MSNERSNIDVDRVTSLMQPLARSITAVERAPFVALLDEWNSNALSAATLWSALRQARSLAVAMVTAMPAPGADPEWTASLQLLPGLGNALRLRRASDAAELGFRLDGGGQPCGPVELRGQAGEASLEIEPTAQGARLRARSVGAEQLLELGAVPAGCWTAQPVPVPRLKLVHVSGPAPFASVVACGPLLIGRNEGCGLRLEDTRVSRRHAQLEPISGTFRIRDLDSSGGTHLNGERLRGPARVEVGDRLRLGDTQIDLRPDGGEHEATIIATAPAAVRLPPTLSLPTSPTPGRNER